MDGHVTSLYYNDLRPESTERDLRIAVTSTKTTTFEVPEDPPWPISQVPDVSRGLGQEWFHSEAPLENVQSIQVCKDNTNGHCLGILLHYHDGSTEALGQWRFDYHIETMANKDNLHQLYFYLGHLKSLPTVQDIEFNAEWELDRPKRVTVAMRGRLMWWFRSGLSGIIIHEQR